MVDSDNDSNWNATHNAGNRFRITYFDIYVLGVTGCQFWIPLGLISFIYAKLCFRCVHVRWFWFYLNLIMISFRWNQYIKNLEVVFLFFCELITSNHQLIIPGFTNSGLYGFLDENKRLHYLFFSLIWLSNENRFWADQSKQ